MTPERLAEIERRASAATAGPWAWRQCYEIKRLHWGLESPSSRAQGRVVNHHLVLHASWETDAHGRPLDEDPDLQFVAHARTDVPELCAALRLAWEECDRKERAIQDLARHSVPLEESE